MRTGQCKLPCPYMFHLAEYFDGMGGSCGEDRYDVSIHLLAVNYHLAAALVNSDIVGSTAVKSGNLGAVQLVGDTGNQLQAVKVSLHTQQILGDTAIHPASRTGDPGAGGKFCAVGIFRSYVHIGHGIGLYAAVIEGGVICHNAADGLVSNVATTQMQGLHRRGRGLDLTNQTISEEMRIAVKQAASLF